MATTLCDLPVELFDAIIDELPEFSGGFRMAVHDIKQLRLVCRMIQIKTRARFGREFVGTLYLYASSSNSRRFARLLGDEIFGKCVLRVVVRMKHDWYRNYSPTEWDALRAKLQDGVFKADIRRELERTPRVGSLTLISPPIPSIATDAGRSLICQIWHMMVRDVLSIIFAMPELPLKLIRIGDLDYCSAATPIHLFFGISMESASLSQLENLVLQGTGGEQCLPPPSSRTPDTSTQTFGDFLALLPNLRSFNYHGRNIDYSSFDCSSGNPPILPSLHKLSMQSITPTNKELLKKLRLAGEALKFLRLDNIRLSTGEWKSILTHIRERQSSRLVSLHLNRLLQGNKYLCFDKILKDRAIVLDSIDSEARGLNWEAILIGTFAYKALEEEVTVLIADDWIWVNQYYDTEYIEINSEEGDDMKMWLDRVIDEHEVI